MWICGISGSISDETRGSRFLRDWGAVVGEGGVAFRMSGVIVELNVVCERAPGITASAARKISVTVCLLPQKYATFQPKHCRHAAMKERQFRFPTSSGQSDIGRFSSPEIILAKI